MSSAEHIIHRTILASMADGVLTLDMGGRITTLNPAAAKLLGVSEAETTGRSFAEVFIADPDFEPLVELVLKAIYESATSHIEEIAIPRGEGPGLPLHVTTSYLRDEEGARLGVIVVLTDLTERFQRQRIKRLMGQYIDDRIVGLLLARQEENQLHRARRAMTVSFCDLAGFTRLSEALEPDALLEVLNAYLSLMSAAIGRAEGITDKYIGDAVMAYWGPPFNTESTQAALACTAALDQLDRLADLDRLAAPHLAGREGLAIGLRIGIATGPVVTGDVGPVNARNFTLIGDSVNVAARLESANKDYGTRILTDEATRHAAGPDFLFREIDSVVLRGLTRSQPVFELMGRREDGGRAGALCAAYGAALAAWREGDMDAAVREARAALALSPEDGPSRRLLTRIDAARERGDGT
ncbi:adenylate/guanylate cyclase domain-containing protein [Ancylobacter terrae]|uniref:adenylate/guanylate cyclase domain-containing protein n=1 Tax=Ancylobacter sp. sgz301288 TaxID=3342077 RepID=UPI003858FBA0